MLASLALTPGRGPPIHPRPYCSVSAYSNTVQLVAPDGRPWDFRGCAGAADRGSAMLIQVTAYTVLDGLVVQCTTARTTETGRSWEHRVLEQIPLSGCDPDEAWDLIWLVGQLLESKAFDRTKHEIVREPESS